jgi:hypothetical protein
MQWTSGILQVALHGYYSAGPGYDFVTDLGSPLANKLVPLKAFFPSSFKSQINNKSRFVDLLADTPYTINPEYPFFWAIRIIVFI